MRTEMNGMCKFCICLLRIIGYSFFIAMFLWGFSLTQLYYAQKNFQNGVEVGIMYCTKPEPKGDLRTNYIGEPTHTSN